MAAVCTIVDEQSLHEGSMMDEGFLNLRKAIICGQGDKGLFNLLRKDYITKKCASPRRSSLYPEGTPESD